MRLIALMSLALGSSLACAEAPPKSPAAPASAPVARAPASQPASSGLYAPQPEVPAGFEVATFAGGCFWCMEKDFEKLEVRAVVSGYMGGHVKRPTYQQVSSRTSGHAEVIQVVYDPKKITYQTLLDYFWVNIDPTTDDRQFCDRGDEYRPEIFVHTPEQRKLADASKATIASIFTKGPIKVKVSDAAEFYPAEVYHQDFYKKSPARYSSYRIGCRRDARLKELWGDQAGGH
jgi:peptide-methionine (S)-S-oxide reductase